jgi:hypothetical protein
MIFPLTTSPPFCYTERIAGARRICRIFEKFCCINFRLRHFAVLLSAFSETSPGAGKLLALSARQANVQHKKMRNCAINTALFYKYRRNKDLHN